MNRLALGTAQFGLAYGISNAAGQVPRAEARAMLGMARAGGMDTVDTAAAYGDSEACLGEAGTRDLKVVTKLPPMPAGCTDPASWVEQQFDASLRRLGRSTVHGLLLHRPAQLLEPGGAGLWAAMVRLKEQRRVARLGVSIYAPQELQAVTSAFRLDLVQAPLNLVDRRLCASGWLGRLHDEGVEVHARSAFLQGLLLMPPDQLPTRFRRWSGLWARWHEWLGRSGVPAVRACLAFVLAQPEVDRVVVGAESCSQLRDILAAAASDARVGELPDLGCDDQDLVDPSRWERLCG